jgi:alpha-N-arabinofuranosidase
LTGEVGALNVIATRTTIGKTLYLKAVNPSEDSVAVELKLSDGEIATCSLQLVAPGSLTARNTLDDPDAVRPQAAQVKRVGKTVRFTLPPISCGVVEIGRK